MQCWISVSSTVVGFFLGLWIPVGDWDLSLVSWWDEGEEGIEKQVLFGKIGLMLGTTICCKRRVREARSGTHKTSSALISATYLVGIFLVFGACQVEVWERCLVKWNWSRTIKGIFFQGSVSEAQIFGHMLKNMCFLNALGDWGCKDCGMNLLWSITL